MNASEAITAAIEKLEDQRGRAFAGPWTAFHSGVEHGDHSYVMSGGEAIAFVSANDGSDEEFRQPTADLIVTLYRTLDVLTDIVRTGDLDGVALARAILGEVSS